MNPKTFEISLRAPVGDRSYHLSLHVETAEAALAWVEQTFVGIDTARTRLRWSLPASDFPRVGNNDPVRVLDLDRCSITVRRNGALVRERASDGQHRRTAEQVQSSLVYVYERIRDDRTKLKAAFQSLKASQERHWVAWQQDRLIDMKMRWDRSKVWEANLWALVGLAEDSEELTLPERHLQAA